MLKLSYSRFVRLTLSAVAIAALPWLDGCTLNNTAAAGAGTPLSSDAAIHGSAHGGQQPLSGATVQLYQVGVGSVAGSAGYSGVAIPLLTSTVKTSTDGTGTFNITGDYSCSAGSEIYLTVTGGSPDGNTSHSNPNITLIAALGSCSTLLANASTAFVNVNEVSTVAAAYALAQFATTSSFGTALSAQPGDGTIAPADNIVTSSSNMQGLVNAMATAQVLSDSYKLTGFPAGTSPGNNTNKSASVEYWTINTIADILATCVNTVPGVVSSPGDGSLCGSLYQKATPTGKTSPADTFQAALYLALYPGDANLLAGTSSGQALASLITSEAPFTPYVDPTSSGNSINDWTVAVSYAPVATGTSTKLLSAPYNLSIDSVGNVWTNNVNIRPSFLLEMDPTGNPVFAGKTACATATCAAADYQVTSFLKSGTTATNIGLEPGAASGNDLAIDTANNVWDVDRNGKEIVFVTGSGTGSTSNGGGATGSTPAIGYLLTVSPVTIAVDGKNQPWFTTGATTPNSGCTSQTISSGGGFTLATISGASSTGTGGTFAFAGPGGATGGTIAIDSGNPSCTAGSTTTACNAAIYDKTSDGTTITGSPFIWVPYSSGIGGKLPNGQTAGTIGHYYTGNGTFTVPGCETPLQQISSINSTVATTTQIDAINPSTSNQIEFDALARGIAFGQNGTFWIANTGKADANATLVNNIMKFTPNYGSAFTAASFIAAQSSPSFSLYTGGGLGSKFSVLEQIVTDGAGSPWAFGNAPGTSPSPVVHLDASGNALSPSTGFLGTVYSAGSTTLQRATGTTDYGGGIDLSGNVWVPNSDTTPSTSIYEIVGAATPVVTPLALGIKNGTLGMMP